MKERILREKPKWDCSKIKKEINKKLNNFINKLSLEFFPTTEGRKKVILKTCSINSKQNI